MPPPSSAAPARASGTSTGRTYLDMSSLAECMNLGHQHPRVSRRSAPRPSDCASSPPPGARSRARSSRTSCCSALRLRGRPRVLHPGRRGCQRARREVRPPGQWQARRLVITRDRSYHGASYAAMALSGDSRTQRGIDPAAFRVLHVPPPYAYRCPFNSKSDARVRRTGRRAHRRCHRRARPRRRSPPC